MGGSPSKKYAPSHVSHDRILGKCNRKPAQERQVVRYGKSICLSQLETIKPLGEGFFGQVKLMADRRTGDQFAVKTAKLSIPLLILQPGLLQALEEEGAIMAKLQHPNIVKLESFCGAGGPTLPFLAMEVCEKGSLLDFAKSLKSPTMQLIVSGGRGRARMLQGVASGMAYLEEKAIVHRDLAARNVLVDKDLNCKITDFGLTKKAMEMTGFDGADGKIYVPVYTNGNPGLIPWKWTAPEGLDGGTFSTKSDVWSFGVLLWEVMTYGETPYQDFDNSGILGLALEAGTRLPKPEDCLDGLYDIMLQCWDMSPGKRPSFAQLDTMLEKLTHYDQATQIKLLIALMVMAEKGSKCEYRRTPKHKHLLKKLTKDGWICDVCLESDPTQERYRCPENGCDWDICIDCLRKNQYPTAEGFSSKHKHVLALSSKDTGWTCDGQCNNDTTNLSRFRCPCEECDFDLCGDCMEKYDITRV